VSVPRRRQVYCLRYRFQFVSLELEPVTFSILVSVSLGHPSRPGSRHQAHCHSDADPLIARRVDPRPPSTHHCRRHRSGVSFPFPPSRLSFPVPPFKAIVAVASTERVVIRAPGQGVIARCHHPACHCRQHRSGCRSRHCGEDIVAAISRQRVGKGRANEPPRYWRACRCPLHPYLRRRIARLTVTPEAVLA